MNASTKPIVTLTAIHHMPSLSDETACFDAIVNIDGKAAFRVENRGNGGCNDHSPLKGQTLQQVRVHIARLNEYAATLPKEKHYGMELPNDADTLIDAALDSYLREKDFKRITKTKFLFRTGKELRTLALSKGHTPTSLPEADRARIIGKIVEKHPDAQVLNFLPLDQALAIYSAGADE